jgi:putative sterol carrier protein
MGPPCEGDFISVDSLALALRGAFRPDRARGPQRLYELRIDGKPLRVAVKSGRVSVPADSPKEPDVVLETEPGVMRELLIGSLPVDDAITSGHLRVDGDHAEASRFVEMFLFPSTEDATV